MYGMRGKHLFIEHTTITLIKQNSSTEKKSEHFVGIYACAGV